MADLHHLGRAAGRARVAELLEPVRSGRRRPAAGVDLLGRDAPAAGSGDDPGRLPAGDLSRRAHDGAGSRAAVARCGTASVSWSPTGSRSFSPPSTWTRPTISLTGSRFSTTVGSSPKAAPRSSSGASRGATSNCSSPPRRRCDAAADVLDAAPATMRSSSSRSRAMAGSHPCGGCSSSSTMPMSRSSSSRSTRRTWTTCSSRSPAIRSQRRLGLR